MAVAKIDRWEVYVAAELLGVYPEPACVQEAPAPYLHASIVLGPTWALRTSTTATSVEVA